MKRNILINIKKKINLLQTRNWNEKLLIKKVHTIIVAKSIPSPTVALVPFWFFQIFLKRFKQLLSVFWIVLSISQLLKSYDCDEEQYHFSMLFNSIETIHCHWHLIWQLKSWKNLWTGSMADSVEKMTLYRVDRALHDNIWLHPHTSDTVTNHLVNWSQ